MRSVVVVLPASMCAMIPMFRVLSRENLRGISESAGVGGSGGGCGQRKRAPRARAQIRGCSRTWRYVLEVSMLAQRAVRGIARMSGVQHGAEGDDSKGFGTVRPALPSVLTLRALLALAGLTGAVMVLVASFTSVIDITVGTTSRVLDADTAQSGWDRHGPALVLLALLALFLLAASLRGARIAMAGLAVVGIAVLAIAWASDRPHVHDSGSVGDVYAEATAAPGPGYYLETLGGVLLLLSGGALLVLGSGAPVAEAAPPAARPASPARRE